MLGDRSCPRGVKEHLIYSRTRILRPECPASALQISAIAGSRAIRALNLDILDRNLRRSE